MSDSRHDRSDPWHRTLELRWRTPHNPLPVRVIQAPPARGAGPIGVGQPWHDTGPAEQPFDFSCQVRRLLEDIVARTPEFSRIDVPRVLISATTARDGRKHGLQARVTPLRFQDGQLLRRRQGITYQIQRYYQDDLEFLYVMTFCLPRFLDQGFDDKMVTLFHELHHIDPGFSGDLRRHPGRCHFHSTNKRLYDRNMVELARAYLMSRPDSGRFAFLRLTFNQLRERHGAITSIVVPRPKIIPTIR